LSYNQRKKYQSINGHLKLELLIDIDEQLEIINEIKFNTTSVLSNDELLVIEQLSHGIKNCRLNDLVKRVNELNLNFNVTTLATNLLIDWLKDYWSMTSINKTKILNDLICHCYNVTKSDLKELLKSNRHLNLAETSAKSKASTGCGKCTELFKSEFADLFIDANKKDAQNSFIETSGHFMRIGELTPIEYALKIDATLKFELLEKGFKQDTIEIMKIEGQHFYLKLNNEIQIEFKDLEKMIFLRTGLFVFFHNHL
jgi:bacterioferritin-associated ferredoxin